MSMETCQGPRTDTLAPRFTVPRGACDCHAHVLGPTHRYPYVSDRSFTPPEAPPEAYLRMLAVLGIERMVVVQPSVYGSDNRRTMGAVAELGVGRTRAVVMVDQDIELSELRRLHDGGARGARFITTVRGGPSLEDLPSVARKVAEVDWHLEMYVPLQVLPDLLPVVEGLPVSVVFDHLGGLPAGVEDSDPTFRAILRLVASGRHWIKLCGYRNSSGHPYRDVAPLARRFITEAPDRCVWGTDWPHTTIEGYMPTDGELLDLLGDWEPDPGVRRKILVDNPAALYRFP